MLVIGVGCYRRCLCRLSLVLTWFDVVGDGCLLLALDVVVR